jgi:poly(ADP-ribose) glycohydrolase ARH3
LLQNLCVADLLSLLQYNGFEKTIIYAISLGGDTDTMATMAGAIAGAHYGVGAISDGWKLACEGVEHAEDQAKKLFNLRFINPFRRF